MLTRLIVGIAFALAILPVAFDYFGPSWRARWILADAANQYDRGNVERARELLKQSFRLSEDIALDPNFWVQLSRMELVNRQPPKTIEEWMRQLEKIEEEPVRRTIALGASVSLSETGNDALAIQLLERFLPPLKERNAIENNQIAYYRALNRSDLDLALEEINEALKLEKNEGNLDTKAWVLHEYDQNEEALSFANQAIGMAESLMGARYPDGFSIVHDAFNEQVSLSSSMLRPFIPPSLDLGMDEPAEISQSADKPIGETDDESDSLSKPSPKKTLPAKSQLAADLEKLNLGQNFQRSLKQLAVLRYHRLKILQALGETREAIDDELWLKTFGFVDTSQLR